MPTWLLFVILLVVILIIVWILLSGSPVIEEEEDMSGIVEAIEEPMVEEPVAEEPIVEEPAKEVEIAETTAEPEAEEFEEMMESLEEIIEPDDLKKIEGIGPKISDTLMAKGIKTFGQLADSRIEDIQAILDEAKIRIANPTTWAEQAKLAANGDWESLEKLQENLKGGRRNPK